MIAAESPGSGVKGHVGTRLYATAVSSVVGPAGSMLRIGWVSGADDMMGDEKEEHCSWLCKLLRAHN